MEQKKPSQTLTLKLDLRIVCIVLVIVIGVMLWLWKPWSTAGSTDRKITVNGQTTLSAEPDEYQFSPYYNRPTTAEVTTLSNTIVAKLKELGVQDRQIKTNASNYERFDATIAPEEPKNEATLSLTITVGTKELAQKVQDYLLTTDPEGSVSPYATFSTNKSKDLEDQARTQAIEDARKRAEQTAKNLDGKLGKVLEVGEGSQGGVWPLLNEGANLSIQSNKSERSLAIQPGENEFTYTVKVTFALR